MPKYLIIIVSHSEDYLSKANALSHALEKGEQRICNQTQKVADWSGNNHWGGALWPPPVVKWDQQGFPLCFSQGDTVGTSDRVK